MNADNYTAPPHSPESERAILGATLLDNRLVSQADELLNPNDFYDPFHRKVFRAMLQLAARGEKIDPITLGEQLKQTNDAQTVSVAEIANLSYGLPHFSDVSSYAAIVRQKALAREMIRTARQIEIETTAEENLPEVIRRTLESFNNFAARAAGKDAALRLIRMSDVAAENVSWLWFPFFPLGKLVLISGEEGLGKSWLTCGFASAVTNGNGFPPDFEPIEAGNVLMLSSEDGLADTIKPRLEAVGARCERVFVVDEPLTFDEKGLLKLESYVAEVKPLLVTIDPIFAYTPAKTDINSANQSRAISARLTEIAAKYNCVIVLIRHIGKAKGFGDARAAGLGSIDWRAAVRSELLIGRNPDVEAERAIVHTKSNLAPLGDSIGFTIENSETGAAFLWTGKSTLTASRILATVKDDETRREQSEAVSFLREVLRDGAKPAKEVKREAEHAGLTEQNLRTARTKLNVAIRREGFGKDSRILWELSE